jgi:hypothetical protein
LTAKPEVTGKRFLAKRAVRARYGNVCARSIRRWVDKGALPPPDLTINGRDYWYEITLDAHDRRVVAEQATKRRRKPGNAVDQSTV